VARKLSSASVTGCPAVLPATCSRGARAVSARLGGLRGAATAQLRERRLSLYAEPLFEEDGRRRILKKRGAVTRARLGTAAHLRLLSLEDVAVEALGVPEPQQPRLHAPGGRQRRRGAGTRLPLGQARPGDSTCAGRVPSAILLHACHARRISITTSRTWTRSQRGGRAHVGGAPEAGEQLAGDWVRLARVPLVHLRARPRARVRRRVAAGEAGGGGVRIGPQEGGRAGPWRARARGARRSGGAAAASRQTPAAARGARCRGSEGRGCKVRIGPRRGELPHPLFRGQRRVPAAGKEVFGERQRVVPALRECPPASPSASFIPPTHNTTTQQHQQQSKHNSQTPTPSATPPGPGGARRGGAAARPGARLGVGRARRDVSN